MKASPTEDTFKRIQTGDWHRASGDCRCETCGKLYYDHAHMNHFEWLTLLCDGTLVKL